MTILNINTFIFCVCLIGMLINIIPVWLIVGKYFDNVLIENNIPLPKTFNFYWSSMNRAINYGAILSRYYLFGKTYKKSNYYSKLFKGFDIYKFARKRDKIICCLQMIFITGLLITTISGFIITY